MTNQTSAPPDGEGSERVAHGLLSLLADDSLPVAATDSNQAYMSHYDGHVVLALDPGASLDIAPALDGLTSSCQLFDVPVLDFGGAADDAAAST